MLSSLRFPARILLAALALGLCADYLLYDRRLGVGAPLFVALGLAALAALGAAEQRRPTPGNLWLAATALFFAGCLAWRSSATLTALNTLATFGLLVLLAIGYCGVPLLGQALPRLLGQLAAGLADMVAQPAALAWHIAAGPRGDGAPAERRGAATMRALRPIGCGLLLALPALIVFTGLLMAADQVFASYVEQVLSLELPLSLADLLAHGLFIGLIAWGCAGGLLVALLGEQRSALGRMLAVLAGGLISIVYVDPAEATLPAEGDTRPLRAPRRALIALGAIEATTVLVVIDLLFGSFMAIQGAYLFGGLDTLARTGMTYAEYARRGFFELLAVACLALGLLCGLAIVTRRASGRERRMFHAACALMIALLLGLLGSAFQRMWLYEQAYGYTELRIYTHSFMIWLAVLLGLFLLALLRGRAQIFSMGGLVAALVYLALLNLANPDALIVRENIGRLAAPPSLAGRGSEEVDAYYLTQLSPDATPALVGALGQLAPAEWQIVAAALAEQHAQLADDPQAAGWPSWHLGRARAGWAIEQAGLAAP